MFSHTLPYHGWDKSNNAILEPAFKDNTEGSNAGGKNILCDSTHVRHRKLEH